MVKTIHCKSIIDKPISLHAGTFFLLLTLFFVSYQSFFGSNIFSYIDELLIFSILLFESFHVNLKSYSMRRRKLILMLLIGCIGWFLCNIFGNIVGSIFFHKSFSILYAFTDIINGAKIFVLFLDFLLMNLSKEETIKLLKLFIIISLPSVFYAMFQYVQFYYRGVGLEGKYDSIDGQLYFRINGFAAHPIDFANQLAIMAMTMLLFMKNKKWIILKVAAFLLFCLLCFLTMTTAMSVLLAVALVFYVILNLKKKIRAIVLFGMAFLLLIFLFAMTIKGVGLFDYIFSGQETTIRYQSIIGTLEAIVKNPFGYGYGSYSSDGFGEAGFFRILYNGGLIGLIFFLYPFIYNIFFMLKKRLNIQAIITVLFFLANGVINEIYVIPGIIWIGLFFCMDRD